MPKNFLENQQILNGIPDHIFSFGMSISLQQKKIQKIETWMKWQRRSCI
jgi:hypothetical protein